MSTIANARAIEAALQRLQGPAASGKLFVKATGADVEVRPGSCAVPVVAGALNDQAVAFVRPNTANPGGKWTVTSAGVLVDVAAVQGGPAGNQPGGTAYRWDPPLEGVEDTSDAEAAGLAGGEYSSAFAGLRQFSHLRTTEFVPGQELFKTQTFDYPAAVLAWARTGALDGPFAGTPGPRTARVSNRAMLFKHTWFLWLVTSRLDGAAARSLEADTLRDDVVDAIEGAMRVRDRAFAVSIEPGASVVSVAPFRVLPTVYVDQITFDTGYVQAGRAEPRDYEEWLRTRLRQQTAAQPPDPPLDLPNIIIPMPPGGPGTPPFP